jgi:sugar phosphate permease
MRFPMAHSRPQPEPTSAYEWYVLGVLFLIYVVAYIDRQVMSVLLQPIKQEFGASDTAMGFLSGIAFAIFYVCVGMPIARWSDRGVRRRSSRSLSPCGAP